MECVDGIDLSEFSAPILVSELVSTRCAGLRPTCGVYVVLRESPDRPVFLKKSGAGWFKGRNPSYPLDKVRSNWVAGATVVYVGKTVSKKGLLGRVRQLVDFACGKRAGHRGGRMLWHLADWQALKVAWRETAAADADSVETALIAAFKREHHGNRPFANLVK